MEYQKILNLLENTPNQPVNLEPKICFEVDGESRRSHNVNSHIKFKASMFWSSRKQ